MQQGQVFELKKRAVDGSSVWAYRYRTVGPGSRRLQRGGFSPERDAAEALERALEHLRRQKGVGSTLTLKELVEEYLAQYDAEPETIDKLCWLLAKALRAFGGRRLPSTPTPPSRESSSLSVGAPRSDRSSHGLNSTSSLGGSGRATSRRYSSRPRPVCGPASGWRSSSATSTAKRESFTSVARS